MNRGRSYKHAKSAGKGSIPRPTDPKKYGEGHERIFGKKKFNGRHFKKSYPDDPKDYLCIMQAIQPDPSVWDAMNRITELASKL